MAMTAESADKAATRTGKSSHTYELVSTNPDASLDIETTLALRWFGPRVNKILIAWSVAHRRTTTVLSEAAKLVAVVVWYTPWRDAAIMPILLCCVPKFACTLLLLSVSILNLLKREFEFWFATALNLVAFIVTSVELGLTLTLGYAFLIFLSVQITIVSDADIFTPSDTARAGLVSCAYTLTLGLFALKRNVEVARLPSTPATAWRQAALNLLSNVAATLAIFVLNKTFKRRRVFIRCESPFVPLAVCRTQLVLQRRAAQSPQLPRVLPVSQSKHLSFVASIPGGSANRRFSDVVGPTEPIFRVRAQAFQFVDTQATLIPRLCIKRRLSRMQYVILNMCGVVGFFFSGLPLLLLFVFDIRDRFVLYPCAAICIVLTVPFCLIHAAHYQRDILRLLLRNFDFWFLTLQFASAKLCIADLLNWDYRCLCIISWSIWFNWVLVNDAMLTSHARKLHFKKVFASLVLFTVLFGIVVVTFSITLDPRDLLPDHNVQLGFLGDLVSVRISTKTALGYRFATIWLWTVRLVSRLAKYPDDKLMFLRGAIEYRNPGFKETSNRARVETRAKT